MDGLYITTQARLLTLLTLDNMLYVAMTIPHVFVMFFFIHVLLYLKKKDIRANALCLIIEMDVRVSYDECQ